MKQCSVTCDYCGRQAELVDGSVVYPGNERVVGKFFWFCKPCDAWTATHENSPTHKPLGRLANGELRESRKRALSAFNPLWMAGYAMLSQAGHTGSKTHCIGIAYKWLSERMGMSTRACHIGVMNPQQCDQARRICQSLGNELLVRFQNELSKSTGL